MAYRRRQGFAKDLTLREEIAIRNPNSNRPNDPSSPAEDGSISSSNPAAATQSLAAQAIRASSAHRDSSLSSAYGQSAISPRQAKSNPARSSYKSSVKDDSTRYDYASMKNLDEPKRGFWGALARKARAIIEDDDVAQQYETPERRRQQMSDTEAKGQYSSPYQLPENRQKADNPALQKGIDAIASSLNYIGGTIGNALEEGMTVVENRTADIIQETRKLHIKKKSEKNPASNVGSTRESLQMHTHNTQPQKQTDTEIQLKASRDVSMAMAAKAKVLLRELKTVKADLAFAKERCAQLEEENRVLRETGRDGDRPEDDDLIRLQLESLLAEKARLAQENSVYARENRFLREIVEYHQLTMQDVVYIDESKEEVSEVYPVKSFTTNSNIVTPTNTNPHVIGDISSPPVTPTSPFLDQHKM
ncbi:uncharacterized protein LOC112505433 [Cynara cardunculus var. scolymus]|uniref:uncharacterized protein LOC112505433 n=1 Tax=Cynara cardunculus var. scolymus TaxID=59895 RepID=UPI000D629D49|nr:uncharacterized protein LOC112505433 [Cynara cardunculus var. scolymus]